MSTIQTITTGKRNLIPSGDRHIRGKSGSIQMQ